MGSFRFFKSLLKPLIGAVRYMPASAFIPPLIIWLGISDAQKVGVVFIGVFFHSGAAHRRRFRPGVPKELVNIAYTLGASRREVFSRVLLPASLPGRRQPADLDGPGLDLPDLWPSWSEAREQIGHLIHRASALARTTSSPASLTIGCSGSRLIACSGSSRRASYRTWKSCKRERAADRQCFSPIRRLSFVSGAGGRQRPGGILTGVRLSSNPPARTSRRCSFVGGLVHANTGEVLVDGQPIAGPGPDRGMVFQTSLYPRLSVRSNRVGLNLAKVSASDAGALDRLIELVRLEGFAIPTRRPFRRDVPPSPSPVPSQQSPSAADG